MNVALVVIISLVIIVPVLAAGGIMMYQSHRAQRQAETSQDKERSVSTDIADLESGGRLKDVVVENFRKKRASLEEIGSTSTTTTSNRDRRARRKRKQQLTKVQSVDDDAVTRVPSHQDGGVIVQVTEV